MSRRSNHRRFDSFKVPSLSRDWIATARFVQPAMTNEWRGGYVLI